MGVGTNEMVVVQCLCGDGGPEMMIKDVRVIF